MKSAQRRLAACVESLRSAGSAVDQQQLHKKLLKELFAVRRLWKPELLHASGRRESAGQGDGSAKKKPKTHPQLFQLLFQTLVVYSGTHTGTSGNGASGATTNLSMALTAPTVPTSECVHQLICDLLVRAFDFSVVPVINDGLAAKTTTVYVKASLVKVVCRLPLQDALQFIPEVVAFTNKTIRAADYYIKQSLLESVAIVLVSDLPRLLAFHGDALKIVAKVFQDKAPEVRIAAARLLNVIAANTTPSNAATSSSSGSSGSGGGGGSGSTGGSGSMGGASSSGGGSGSGGGAHPHGHGVTLEAILQVATKGMDDLSVEARREYAGVVGLVLAKFATSSAGEGDLQSNGEAMGSSRGPDDDDAPRPSSDSDSTTSSGSGSAPGSKSKLPFKLKGMHVPGMAAINLSRRKAAAVNFSTIASVIQYFKDMIITKHLSPVPSQGNGGILSSFAIALCGMFRRLPPDSVADTQIQEVLEAILLILDHPFSLSDLARARNAVSFVLRNGLFLTLTERQQDTILGIYLQKLKEDGASADANHHKVLSILVEMSHSYHAMGEAAVGHAEESSSVLQGLLCHEKQSVRFQAAVALASLVTALPYHLKRVLLECLDELHNTAMLLIQEQPHSSQSAVRVSDVANDDNSQIEQPDLQSKIHLYSIQGRSTAVTHILRAITVQKKSGLSHEVLTKILTAAEELVESQFLEACPDSIWLTCTRAGWSLISSLTAFNDDRWTRTNLQKLLDLWLRSSVLHNRESSLELLRIEAAVVALSGFLGSCQSIAAESDDVHLLANHVLQVYLAALHDPLSNPRKRRGQVARYRVISWVIKCFTMLPPMYSDSYILLLDLIAEHTTAQALTSLRQSSLVPAESTFLHMVLSSNDDLLEQVSSSRLVPGDQSCPLYSRETNLSLGLQQPDNLLSDTEVEVQYLDNFWAAVFEDDASTDAYERGICSSSTYVRLVDVCVYLFGRVFHFLPEDLQLRCLQHFAGILADDRVSCEINVCSLLFAIVREASLSSAASSPLSGSSASLSLATAGWPSQVQTMLCEMIGSENSKVRRGAGEAIGILAAVLPQDPRRGLVIDIEKRLVADKLPASNTTTSAFTTNGTPEPDPTVLFAGAAFALACIKRACGSMISIDSKLIYRFAGEATQPLRTWILHAWSIIMETVNTAGEDYDQFITSTFAVMEAQLLAGFRYSKANKKGLRWQSSAKTAIGRIINGMVATVGPELGASGERLSELFAIWELLRQEHDANVELQYVKFLEQVAVLAPAKFRTADFRHVLTIVSELAVISSPSFPALGRSSSDTTLDIPAGFWMSGCSGPDANGISRALLQKVALSCVRTVVEREPALIQGNNLHCLLFAALHVEFNDVMWRYLPRLHGMWDVLTFKCVSLLPPARNSVDDIRGTILALLEIDGGNRADAQPCVWALLCRSIAIGESSNNFSGETNDEQLMMSPKGADAISALSASTDGAAGRDSTSWPQSTAAAVDTHDDTLLASASIAAQVETWRATKKSVSEMVALLPPLSRQVRHFAVEAVLRVFELAESGSPVAANLHFDLVATRGFYLDKLKAEILNSASIGGRQASDSASNFLCMYLDEFVTLACHVSTSSADTSELQMFQSSGLQLLNALLKRFGAARDPEVATGDALLLDPYQAQLSAALRHALKQTHVDDGKDGSSTSRREFYAPLLIEAHAVCANCISARLVQDKVALNRILKMVITSDYGHHHFVGDDVTRTNLALANLSTVAGMLVAAISVDGPASDNVRAMGPSSLTKTLINAISDHAEYIVNCWTDATYAYGILMQGCGSWPRSSASRAAEGSNTLLLESLKIFVPTSGSDTSSGISQALLDKLRESYRCYWPSILRALAYLQTFNSELRLKTSQQPSDWPSVLVSFSLFHLASSYAGRDRADEELVPVLESLPLLVSFILKGSNSDDATRVEVLRNVLTALMSASLRATSGVVRAEALRALFACVSRANLDAAIAACGDDSNRRSELIQIVCQAGLCPLEGLLQLTSVNRQSVGGITASDMDDGMLIDVLRLATNGIVFLHKTVEVRASVVDALALTERCLGALEAVCASSKCRESVMALSRASVEAFLALSKTADADTDTSELPSKLQSRWKQGFGFVSTWVDTEISSISDSRPALAFVLRVVINYTVTYPAFAHDDAVAFHATIARVCVQAISGQRDLKDARTAATATVLHGLLAVVKKLVDVQETAIARCYLALLGPTLVRILERERSSVPAVGDIEELDATEELVRVLVSQLDDEYGAAFVRLVLPKICAVLQQATTAMPAESAGQVSAVMSRLLLCFAQTRPAAFKEVVGAMAPTARAVLEATLRTALTSAAASSAPSSSAFGRSGAPELSSAPARKLDLSRYS